MNPCQRFKEQLFDLVDNELDILQKKELEGHLRTCVLCSRFLEQIRRLRSQCKQLSSIKVSDEFHVLLRDRIRREMAGKRGVLTPSSTFSVRWIPAFGVMLVFMFFGFWMLDQKTSFIGGPDNSVTMTGGSISQSQDYDGEVEYIIDDYLNLFSVSQAESEEATQLIDRDSIYHREREEDFQRLLRPVVSF